MRVLVVEGSVPLRRQIVRFLEDNGCAVVEAVSHVDALRVLGSQGVPHGFIVSNSLDGGKGGGFVQGLGKISKTRDRPTVLLIDNPKELSLLSSVVPLRKTVVPVLRGGEVNAFLKKLLEEVRTEEAPPAIDGPATTAAAHAGNAAAATSPPDLAASREEAAELVALGKAYDLLDEILKMVSEHRLPGPMVPDMLMRVRQLFADPDVKFAEIAKFCVKYQTLAARLIMLANSALYAPAGRRVATVEVAVSRLGLKQTSGLLQAVAAQEFIVGRNPELRQLILDNLECAYGVGILSEELAKAEGEPWANEAYTIGLFHNIGPTFLFYAYALLRESKEAAGLDLALVKTIAANRAGDLNRILCKAMNLPIEVVAVMASAESANDTLVRCIHRAIWMTEKLLARRRADDLVPDAQAELLGLTGVAIERVQQKVPAILELLSAYRP